MKAMIFAAGLGSRLKPLTDTMPKALVPVDGKPMLEHVILKLRKAGFTDIVINIHHFGQQIIDFLKAKDNFGLHIQISDERDFLLDTGGGIRKAAALLHGDEPVLIHNVDILSNADLKAIYSHHRNSGQDATLVVSKRETSRYLLFDDAHRLHGWINRQTGQTKPQCFVYDTHLYTPYAFSGIHVVSPSIFRYMDGDRWNGKFSITEFYLDTCHEAHYQAYVAHGLRLMDIGKPDTIKQARQFIDTL